MMTLLPSTALGRLAEAVRPVLAILAGLVLALALSMAVLATLFDVASQPALAQLSEPNFPALTGRVVDEAGLLSAADRQALDEELAALEEKSTDQVVVLTVKSLQGYDIADYATKLGRKWGIGQKGKDNGVILIVAPAEHKVRIEVGRRLEPVLNDGLAGTIIRGTITPSFRRGDFAGGVRAGVRDIKDVLLGDAEAVKDRAKGGGRPPPGVDYTGLVIMGIWIAIVLFSMYRQAQLARANPQALGRRRGLGDGNIVFIPGGFGGSWGGGGGSGGGGGWGGGGGDFGGGGASGSW